MDGLTGKQPSTHMYMPPSFFVLVQMQNLVNAQKCHISGATSQTVRHPSLTVNRTSRPANPNP